jgi:hypothetical protein
MEGGNETLSHREGKPSTHTHGLYMDPTGVVNDSTTPNSTTGDTTHAGAFM